MVFEEKVGLLPNHDQRRKQREEEATLMQHASCSTCNDRWAADRLSFLIGYMVLSAGANLYLAIGASDRGTLLYYVLSSVASAIGLYGASKLNPTCIFLYATFLGVSFMFSAAVSGCAMILLLQEDVCNAVGSAFGSPKLYQYCLASPVRFQLLSVGTIFAELFLELFILYQVKKQHAYALHHKMDALNGDATVKAKPDYKLGTIAILRP